VDATITVESRVRDRLAQLARERGTTISGLLTELAEITPTHDELAARADAATVYVREHINPHLSDADLAAGERFWAELEAGRLPSVSDLYPPDGKQVA
jgi:predicted DNA-binding ribbon-helix-helix protein